MQCACAMLSTVPYPVLKIFPHYFIKGPISKKKVIDYDMCFDFLYKFCLKHFQFQEEFGQTVSKTYIGRRVKNTLFFSDFNEN